MKKFLFGMFVTLCLLPLVAKADGKECTITVKDGDTVLGHATIQISLLKPVNDQNIISGATPPDGTFVVQDYTNVDFIKIKPSTGEVFTIEGQTVINTCGQNSHPTIPVGNETTNLEDFVVPGCSSSTGVEKIEYDKQTQKCVIKKCSEPRYKLENNTCIDQVGADCTSKIKHATAAKYEMDGEKLVCRVSTCDEPAWVANNDNTGCDASDGPCPDSLLKQLEHASAGQMRKGQCIATKCDSDDYEVKKGKCVLKSGGCTPTQENAKTGKYETRNGELVCVITKCNKGYLPNDDGTQCEISEGQCTSEQIAAMPKAASGEMKKGECFITECEKGWHPSKDKKKCEQADLSEADSKQKVAELKDNAKKMKDKEQSTANKMLGGAAIGATGFGAMNLASGLAEQKADSAAEEDMKAYLATFVCDYGQGRNIKGGETNIDLPGGNDLFAAVNEYRALAADLKTRKEALGKQPGIESEVIIDAADTGLYDNVGMGRQKGAYTSLSRALTDKTGEDAAEWAKQKSDTASKIKTGAITAGAGAIGGMIGNLAINSGEKNKNKVDEINKKYEGLKQPLKQLEQEIQQIPSSPEPTTCPANADGTYPNCKCNGNAVYTSGNECVTCGDNEEPNQEGNQCVCRQGYSGTPCMEIPTVVTPKCTITNENRNNVNVDESGNCTCANGFPDVPTCTCNPETHVWQNKTCTQRVKEEELTITLSAASLFDTNKSELKDEAKTALNNFKDNFNKWYGQNPNSPHCIKIIGHTDKTGRDKINNPLSERRAKAVESYLSNNGIDTTQLTSKGVGSSQCPQSGNQPSCRKVEVTLDTKNCDGSGATVNAPQVANPLPLLSGVESAAPLTENDMRQKMSKAVDICEKYRGPNNIIGKFVVSAESGRWSSYEPAIHQKAYCIFVKQVATNGGANDPIIQTSKEDYRENLMKFALDGYNYAPDDDKGLRCKSLFDNKQLGEALYHGNGLPTGQHGNFTACEFSYKFK